MASLSMLGVLPICVLEELKKTVKMLLECSIQKMFSLHVKRDALNINYLVEIK